MASVLFVLALVSFQLSLLALYIYGVVLCFKKNWLCGLAGLVVGIFAIVVALAKLTCNKNLLN